MNYAIEPPPDSSESFAEIKCLLQDFLPPALEEKGGEMIVLLTYFELQTGIEQFLLMARSLPDLAC
jgi:hypothetical protein